MILDFQRSTSEENSLVSSWRGIVVLLAKSCSITEPGLHDVMFIRGNSKSIIATNIDGLRLDSLDGFQRLRDKRVPPTVGIDAQGNKMLFRIGWLLPKDLYVADQAFADFRNIPLLRLGGTYYTIFSNGHYYVCGVEDPSMLLKFASKHINFKKLF